MTTYSNAFKPIKYQRKWNVSALRGDILEAVLDYPGFLSLNPQVSCSDGGVTGYMIRLSEPT